jgi:hypothetical protein
MNVDFVSAHEQLCNNVNAFWGPEQAPFSYTTSKWGRESSVELSSDSDDSYQTPPMVKGSSRWDQFQEDQSSRGDGEKSLLKRSMPSLSSLRSQPLMPRSGGPIQTFKRWGRQAQGKLVKASWTRSSKSPEETGSFNSPRRKVVRSPSSLEYLSDVPREERDRTSPDWSRQVPGDYFLRMDLRLAEVDLGRPPCDEESGRARFGIGWTNEAERIEAERVLALDDANIAGLVDTHRPDLSS